MMPLPASPVRTISFAPALLAAVRAGHKTATRRRIAHPGLQAEPTRYTFAGLHADEARFETVPAGGTPKRVCCPFGQPGDWLRVLEDPALLLRIAHLRAEPVRAITEAGALAEGIAAYPPTDGPESGFGPQYGVLGELGDQPLQPSAVAAFARLLAGFYPTAWARNEWVWVVGFQCFPLGPTGPDFPAAP